MKIALTMAVLLLAVSVQAAPAPQAANAFAFRLWRAGAAKEALGPWAVYASAAAISLRASGPLLEAARVPLGWDARKEAIEELGKRRSRLAELEPGGLRLATRFVFSGGDALPPSFLRDVKEILGEVPETWPSAASPADRVSRMSRGVAFSTRGRLRDFATGKIPPPTSSAWIAAATVLEASLDLPSSSYAAYRPGATGDDVSRAAWIRASGLVDYGENEGARWIELSLSGKTLALFLYLPRSGRITEKELEGWDESWLTSLRGRLRPRAVALEFPRLEVDSGTVVVDAALARAGWPKDFPATAFWHRARVSISPSPVALSADGAPKGEPLKVDGAFFWSLVERESGTILAMGSFSGAYRQKSAQKTR
jgi:serine protease inhibitor